MKRFCAALGRVLGPKTQVRLAWAQLVISLIGWPASLVLIDEPKVILSLSWWAILATAAGHLSAAQANATVSGDAADGQDPDEAGRAEVKRRLEEFHGGN